MKFTPTPEQAKKPEVLAWVLASLEDAQELGDAAREETLLALLDGEAVEAVVSGGDIYLQGRLLQTLPVERLAAHDEALLSLLVRCPTLPSRGLIAALAKCCPERLTLALREQLGRGESLFDWRIVERALQAACALGEAGVELLDRVEDALDGPDDILELLSLLVRACIEVGQPARAQRWLVQAWGGEEEAEDPAYETLAVAFRCLAPHAAWAFDHFVGVFDGPGDQALAGLPELFLPGAPLEDLDRLCGVGLEVEEFIPLPDVVAAALPLIPVSPGAPGLADFARGLHRGLKEAGKEHLNRDLVAALLLGAAAAGHARVDLSEQTWPAERIPHLVAAGLDPNPGLDRAAELLSGCDEAERERLLRQALELAEGQGEANLVQLTGRCGPPALIPYLIEAMRADRDPGLGRLAAVALARAGSAAEEALLSGWEQLGASRRIFAARTLGWVGGEATVIHLLDELPRLKGDHLELDCWCVTARRLPDPRLLEALEVELNRRHSEVEETYITLCALLDQEPPALHGLRERWLERRRKPRAIDDVLSGLDQPGRQEPMDLDLRCPACGETYCYQVSQAWMGIGKPNDGVYIADDLTCRACGEDGPLEPSGTMAQLTMTAQLLRATVSLTRDGENQGALRLIDIHLNDGREVSPAQAVQEYRQRLERQPDHVPDLVGLGNIYYHLGPERRAAACLERALALEPATPEAALSMAYLREGEGDLRGALSLLREAHAVRHRWRFHRLNKDDSPQHFEEEFVLYANELAENLGEKGLPLPDGRIAPYFDPPHLPRPAATIRRAGPKVGRNEPCPCGSGKKYKKCCLRKG